MWRYYIGGVVLFRTTGVGFDCVEPVCKYTPYGGQRSCRLRSAACLRLLRAAMSLMKSSLPFRPANADEMVSKFSEMGVVTHFDLPLADRNDQVAMRMSNLLGNYFWTKII